MNAILDRIGCVEPKCEYRKARHLHKTLGGDRGVWFFEPYTVPECRIPDWPNNLNDCFRMEETLTEDQGGEFEEHLEAICQEALELSGANHWLRFKVAHATPAQRCEAFLKTLKLWSEESTHP